MADNRIDQMLQLLEHAKIGEEVKLVIQRLLVASDTVR